MTIWVYVEPGEDDKPVTREVSEEEILHTFYHWWRSQMMEVGKHDLISVQKASYTELVSVARA